MKVNYVSVDKFLAARQGKIITASALAHGIGVDRIYGPTMSKLVRDNCITPMAEKGFYRVNGPALRG